MSYFTLEYLPAPILPSKTVSWRVFVSR